MAKKFGIDINAWQKGYPYANAKKDGVEFAILRAGYDKSKDTQFETHYKNAKKQGWGVGAYWYTYAQSVEEAKKEAQVFLKAIKGKQFEYPIYLDIEDKSIRKIGKTVLNKIVEVFAEEITKNGYYFGVYSNADWYRNVISGKELNKKYDWWIASWTKTKPSDVNAGLWQFGGDSNPTRSNKVAGIVTDQNYALKDYPSIIKEKGLNGFAKEQKEEKKKDIYTLGNYKTLTALNVRKGAGTIYGKKKVKDLTADGKKNVIYKNNNDYAVYKKGTIFTALKITKNINGSYWAKTPSGYVCIADKKEVYCKKI